jgi:excinuclease ABC subunit C
MTGETPLLRGHAAIRACLGTLGTGPGVYRMLDAESRVLYVGKARNLKARVTSYSRTTGHSARIARMIAETASMMFLSTETEVEALLLEQNLIKQLKPRYNVLARDDKSFPNILVAKDHPYPQIRKHRGARREKGSYYGPFASAGAVNRTLNQLQKVFLLRSCTDSTFSSRSRPCLLFQIRRCSAPCVGYVSEDGYGALVADAERFLQGRSTRVQETLAAEMHAASEAMEFERAAALRDRIRALTQIQGAQGINPAGVPEADVVALHMEGGQACVQVFFIRANQNWGNRDFYPRTGAGAEAPEVMQAFLGQFYAEREPPRLILLSHPIEDPDLMTVALSQKLGRRVEILVPQRGEKAELVGHAASNARESLARRMSEGATQARLLEGLAETLRPRGAAAAHRGLRQLAHHGHRRGRGDDRGRARGLREKSQYRKFNIKGTDLTPGDDFAMMREMLTRRFRGLLKEDPDRETPAWPDLLLIDGGAGQVGAVAGILADLGVDDIAGGRGQGRGP